VVADVDDEDDVDLDRFVCRCDLFFKSLTDFESMFVVVLLLLFEYIVFVILFFLIFLLLLLVVKFVFEN